MKIRNKKVIELKIEIPKKHHKYIELFNTKYFPQIFKDGLKEVVDDVRIGSDTFDMNENLLRGKTLEIKIPIKYEDVKSNLILISKVFKIPIKKVKMGCLLQGLFDGWLLLKDTEQYSNDQKFKKLVDKMPHDLCFDIEDFL